MQFLHPTYRAFDGALAANTPKTIFLQGVGGIASNAVGVSVVSRVVNPTKAGFVNVGDSVSEDDIYAQFKFARSDMRKAIIADLKKAKPEDRRWIDLDLAIGAYVLRGIGATPPEGWTGYEPQNLVGVAAEASDATLAAASMA